MTPSAPGTVLVIDDDPLMRELLHALLEVEGIAVSTAESGEAALKLLAEARPDVVLTDLQMPDTHPATLTAALRDASGGNLLLLGMSGSPADEHELILFDGFLLKPFSTEEFVAAVEQARQSIAVEATPQQASQPSDTGESAAPVLDMQVYEKLGASLKPAALAEMYRITLDDVRSRLTRMRVAHAGGDHETCRREAHAIKGGCGMVGAMELRAEAAALETGAPADTPALQRLEAGCQRLERMLVGLL